MRTARHVRECLLHVGERKRPFDERLYPVLYNRAGFTLTSPPRHLILRFDLDLSWLSVLGGARMSGDEGLLPERPTPRADPSTSFQAISLPKGGGAIRGIGEKFAANPTTGTASISVPVATSPGRGGFGPELSLSYDSGSGNGAFGLGWTLSLPYIVRKTDKGLPQYDDANESDVFILSGAEDLVPALQTDETGDWSTENSRARIREVQRAVGGIAYTIRSYRPRLESAFARIERWTRQSDGDTHWRSISNDNILTLYGLTPDSRIADPEYPRRVFTWLISETRDDRGNAVLYDYKHEDGSRVDLAKTCEASRGGRNDARRTANRYLKRIRYGNRTPLLDGSGARPQFLAGLPASQMADAGWMFEVVFDYGEHDGESPVPEESTPWAYREDPFSSYRAGFEVRTTRLCRRVLMFHHVPALPTGEAGYDGLVRSTDLTYSTGADPHEDAPVYTYLRAITQTGHRRANGGYLRRSLPALEFEYTQPAIQDRVEVVDAASLKDMPAGVDAVHQWIDLHGEGVAGILTEQAGAWFYKRNLSPANEWAVEFTPMSRLALKPNAWLSEGRAQFVDLDGKGAPDLALLDGPVPGFYRHDEDEGWEPFRPFASHLNRDTLDPNVRLVDLDGDGHADVLITEDHALVWHRSLAEIGFAPGQRVPHPRNEEQGPRLVFGDGTESIYLADVSGDGLSDMLRIRNGDVCYWPNLGYGRFGAKVTMDRSPRFDNPDQFDLRRIRIADIDGSGTADIIYLHRDGVRLYFNQSGNCWSGPRQLAGFPARDNTASIKTVDLIGNGTTCLVWSSPLPGNARQPMRYVNLMGSKPHLLVKVSNNLGVETLVSYASSTTFYLRDREAGCPWISRLPFPVHVVEQVEVIDRVSGNRFVTRYAYHHGHFDGQEREFRGFGLVEQWDTESFGVFGDAPATNEDVASHVPPVHTKTWFHTGRCGEDSGDPRLLAGAWRAATGLGLATLLPLGLTPAEEREACRALKGSMLRQEIYGRDGSIRQDRPYTVVEQTFAVRLEQPRGGNRHAVFFRYPRETMTWHHEREPSDPRVQHKLTLEVDRYGNVLREATIAYGRRQPDPSLLLRGDRDKQVTTLILCTQSKFTNAIDDLIAHPDDHRGPLQAESRVHELTGFLPENGAPHFHFDEWTRGGFALIERAEEILYEMAPDVHTQQKRLIDHVRTLFRPDDLGAARNDASALLPLATLERLALAGESYRLAFTPGLLSQVFRRDGELLMPDVGEVLEGPGSDKGGYLSSRRLKADGRFPQTDPDGHWWSPSGRSFFSPTTDDPAAQELAYARRHFFLIRRSRDPFHSDTIRTERAITFDRYDLLMLEVTDALGNRVTAGERDARGAIIPGNDYRVLQPAQLMDPNRNRTQVAFDALGLVAGSALLGKPEETLGDSLVDFSADLSDSVLHDHLADPLADPAGILGRATTRVIYDLFAHQNGRRDASRGAATVYTLSRETHHSDLGPGEPTRFQHEFSFSDGFGREIQRKKFAGNAPSDQGGATEQRWIVSGWVIFNNKGKPVRQYEPFFSPTTGFEFDVRRGVSAIVFYDPLSRVVGTARPDHTYEKTVFDSWSQIVWDANDTTMPPQQPTDLAFDPKDDPDIGPYFRRLPDAEYLPTWLDCRMDASKALQAWPDSDEYGTPLPDNARRRASERAAADKAMAHACTPKRTLFDTLGRAFLTFSDNGEDLSQSGRRLISAVRFELDVQGRQRAVGDAVAWSVDPQGRTVMRYVYNMLGNRIYQQSMEAGTRWKLNDVSGKVIRAWDSRGHRLRTEHDPLRRPLRLFATGAAPATDVEILAERLVYGEQHPQAEQHNLRAALYLRLDQAGAVATERNDFKGHPLSTSRQLTVSTYYRSSVDWTAVDSDHAALPPRASDPLDFAALEAALASWLESEVFVAQTTYDAMNRAVTLTTPRAGAVEPSVIRLSYVEADLLDAVAVNADPRPAQERAQALHRDDVCARSRRQRRRAGLRGDGARRHRARRAGACQQGPIRATANFVMRNWRGVAQGALRDPHVASADRR
jgi:hypothetical protein